MCKCKAEEHLSISMEREFSNEVLEDFIKAYIEMGFLNDLELVLKNNYFGNTKLTVTFNEDFKVATVISTNLSKDGSDSRVNHSYTLQSGE